MPFGLSNVLIGFGDLNIKDSGVSISSIGSAFTQTATKTASYTAVNGDEVLCDANGASGDITITLPASPTAGMQVRIVLITEHATRKVLIARNGSSIDGRTTSDGELYYTLWKNGDTCTFKYVGGSTGWFGFDRKIANRYSSKAYLGTTANNIATGETQVGINTIVYDYNNNFNTGTYVYTCPFTGLYSIVGNVSLIQYVASKRYSVAIKKNTSTYVINQNYITGALVDYQALTVNATVLCNSNDTLGLYIYNTSGATTADEVGGAEYETYLCIDLVSRI